MKRDRSLPRSSRWIWSCLVLVPAMALTGCQTLSSLLDTTPKPSARIAGVSFKDLSLTALTLLFDVEVTNPYEVPLPLVNLDYALSSTDKPFLSGTAPVQEEIPAKKAKVVPVPAQLSFEPILRLVEGVKPGAVVPYRADLKLSVDAPVVGKLIVPLSHSGELPIPAVPSVSVPRIAWKDLSLESASGVIDLAIKNTNSFPFDLKKLAFNFILGDTKVGGAAMDRPASFQPGGENTLEIPISISLRSLGLSALKLLSGEGRAYKLDGSMSLGTPFGPLEVPLVQAGSTKLQK